MAFVPPPGGAHCNQITALADASSCNYWCIPFMAPSEPSPSCSHQWQFQEPCGLCHLCMCVYTAPWNLWCGIHHEGSVCSSRTGDAEQGTGRFGLWVMCFYDVTLMSSHSLETRPTQFCIHLLSPSILNFLIHLQYPLLIRYNIAC